MSDALLRVRGLTRRFGGLVAVSDLDLDLREGEILAVIGPNGAGKTTTFNLIAGADRPSAGTIALRGQDIAGMPAHARAALGLTRTFQHNMPFAGMSLEQNILVGRHTRFTGGIGAVLLGAGRLREEEAQARRLTAEMIAFTGLGARMDADVSTLSFGEGRLLEVARALVSEPRVLLLDEPAAGLTGPEIAHLSQVIANLSARGVAVLLIDHDMRFVLPLAQRIVVLNFGRKIADASPQAVVNDPGVIDAYLGKVSSPQSAGGGHA